jgi:sensor histidine kinase regulating citrate/malate metabolism
MHNTVGIMKNLIDSALNAYVKFEEAEGIEIQKGYDGFSPKP